MSKKAASEMITVRETFDNMIGEQGHPRVFGENHNKSRQIEKACTFLGINDMKLFEQKNRFRNLDPVWCLISDCLRQKREQSYLGDLATCKEIEITHHAIHFIDKIRELLTTESVDIDTICNELKETDFYKHNQPSLPQDPILTAIKTYYRGCQSSLTIFFGIKNQVLRATDVHAIINLLVQRAERTGRNHGASLATLSLIKSGLLGGDEAKDYANKTPAP